jgi:gas vesicle protein
MNNTTKILTAFALGAAAGAVLGILFAPNKGCETRRKIKEQGKKLSEELKNTFNQAKEKACNQCQS